MRGVPTSEVNNRGHIIAGQYSNYKTRYNYSNKNIGITGLGVVN